MSDILINRAWKSLRKEILKQPGKRSMAIAYVTSDTIPLRRGDQLICDASSTAIKSGQTSAEVLDALHRKGVEVYSLKNLHAKIAVCGKLAIIGSANYSDSSDTTLHEAVLATEDGHLRALTLGAIGDLRSDATRLTQATISRLTEIVVERKFGRGAGTRKRKGNKGRRVKLAAWLFFCDTVEEDSLTTSERTKIIEERTKWQRRFGKDNEEPLWFSAAARSRIAQDAKCGTVILAASRTKKRRCMDGMYTVHSVVKTNDKKRVILTCQESEGDISEPWGKFLNWAKSKQVVLPKRHPRRLTPHEYEIIRTHPVFQ